MKFKEKEEARRLRKEFGLPLKEISEKLGVSKGSVSLWVRNIELTDEQKLKLCANSPNHMLGSKKLSKIKSDTRKQYQNFGAEKIKNSNDLFLAGCMLFWAEGSKCKNSLIFVNSDVFMIKIFMKFLRECIHVEDKDIKISINCYTSNGIKSEEIEEYWLKETKLTKDNLNKTIINNIPSSGKSYKKNKLFYGICRITVHSTEIVQQVFGAINAFCGCKEYRWID